MRQENSGFRPAKSSEPSHNSLDDPLDEYGPAPISPSRRAAMSLPPPIAQGDSLTITATRQADGSMRLTRSGWESYHVAKAGEVLELRLVDGQVWAIKRPIA